MIRVLVAACLLAPLLAACHSTLSPTSRARLVDPCRAVSDRAMSDLLGAPVTGVEKGQGEVPPCEWATDVGHRRDVVIYTYRYDASFDDALDLMDGGVVRRVNLRVPGADHAQGRVYTQPDRRQLVVAMRGRQLALAFVSGVGDSAGIRIGREALGLLLDGSA